MDHLKILIDINSIKPNPDAGRTSAIINRGTEWSGEYTGEIPDWLKDHVIEICKKPEGNGYKTQFIGNGEPPKDFFERAKEDENLGFEVHANSEVVHWKFPDPEYLFKYERTALKCDECGNEVPVVDIVRDYDFGGYALDECPKCEALDSFPVPPEYREFEDIDDALKRAENEGIKIERN